MRYVLSVLKNGEWTDRAVTGLYHDAREMALRLLDNGEAQRVAIKRQGSDCIIDVYSYGWTTAG